MRALLHIALAAAILPAGAAPSLAQGYAGYDGDVYVTVPTQDGRPSRRSYDPRAIVPPAPVLAGVRAGAAVPADDYDGGYGGGYGGGLYDEYGQATGRVRAVPRAADVPEVAPRVTRETVAYAGPEAPGTIVVRSAERRLYLVTGHGEAISYGVGVGRPGFGWTGEHAITAMREWPSWTPPAEMVRRRPDLPRHMQGGVENPLGARAMYLGSSLYRIHGSNEPETIGTAVSSGCIRMTNEDVVDLYTRVHVGTRVVVR